MAGLLGQDGDLSAENTIKLLKQVGFNVGAGQASGQKDMVGFNNIITRSPLTSLTIISCLKFKYN